MELSVASILSAQESVTRYSFQETLDLDGDERMLEPVTGELEVTRASLQILQLQGSFKTRLELVCDRCGEPFEYPVTFELEEALEVVDGPVTSEEVEETVSALGTLNASDLVRQSLLLSLPARKLCGCEPSIQAEATEKLDPRWAALRSIHQEPNGKH